MGHNPGEFFRVMDEIDQPFEYNDLAAGGRKRVDHLGVDDRHGEWAFDPRSPRQPLAKAFHGGMLVDPQEQTAIFFFSSNPTRSMTCSTAASPIVRSTEAGISGARKGGRIVAAAKTAMAIDAKDTPIIIASLRRPPLSFPALSMAGQDCRIAAMKPGSFSSSRAALSPCNAKRARPCALGGCAHQSCSRGQENFRCGSSVPWISNRLGSRESVTAWRADVFPS